MAPEEEPNAQWRKDKGKAGQGFATRFYGGSALRDAEKASHERLAHEEYYRQVTGKDPPATISNADIKCEIEKIAEERVNVTFVIVSISEQDRTGSFINHLDHLGSFLRESRRRFVTDAINELKVLGGTRSERGDSISQDKFKLCLALLKAQNMDGHGPKKLLDADHNQALNALRGTTELKDVFRAAEAAFLKGQDGRNGNATVRAGGERQGMPGESREERTRDRTSFDRS